MKSIAKIWIIIIILAITFWALIQWGADTYKESSETIKNIEFPDYDVHLTTEILQSVIQSDVHLNNYIITNKDEQKILAQRLYLEADSMVKVLRKSFENESIKMLQIDSLQKIISEKDRVNRVLLNIKKRQNSHFFTEQALNKIKDQISDSAFIEIATTQKENIVLSVDTIEQTDIIKLPDNYKGFKGFFRKLVGKEKVAYDTQITKEPIEDYSIYVTENSKITKNYFIDTTVQAVKDILVEILTEEIQLQKSLHKIELSIISYNEQLVAAIRNLLNDISNMKDVSILDQQSQAIAKIQDANRKAFFIAGIGLLLGLILLIFLIKDITKSNLYRKKLEEEKHRAEELAKVKEMFLSSMSHEIRTPLHSIGGFTELLDKEVLTEHQKELLKGISHAHLYLSQLINNILIQAKINADAYQVVKSKVWIPELTQMLETLFHHEQLNKSIDFKIDYSKNLKEVFIELDAIKLQQVLINLISNAFKFTQKGSIEVHFELIENTLNIQVKDSGIGINSHQLEKIFLPFQQAHDPSNTVVTGTGLGLSITKHIVESFGGTMKVQSAVQKGSSFHLQFPVQTQIREVQILHTNKNLYERIFFPIHVLAVEDDEWNRYLLQQYLKNHVQKLTIFEQAEQALDFYKVQQNSINLILTDLNLPGMNGKEFFLEVQNIHPTPMIAYSAGMSHSEVSELQQLGFKKSIRKPFQAEDLLSAMLSLFPANQKENIENKAQNLEDDWLAEFAKSLENKIKILEQSITSNNIEELARIAHQLRSNLEQLQIFHLSEQLQSIELFAQLNNPTRTIELSQKIMLGLKEILTQIQMQNHNKV